MKQYDDLNYSKRSRIWVNKRSILELPQWIPNLLRKGTLEEKVTSALILATKKTKVTSLKASIPNVITS